MVIAMKNGLLNNKFGDKFWYKDDKYHREDGPAVEWVNGSKEWWINGQLHREDGPAAESNNGEKYWYLNGERIYSQEEFERLIKLKAFW
jgi:hypothetical protein